jgi:hypothetical protein
MTATAYLAVNCEFSRLAAFVIARPDASGCLRPDLGLHVHDHGLYFSAKAGERVTPITILVPGSGYHLARWRVRYPENI